MKLTNSFQPVSTESVPTAARSVSFALRLLEQEAQEQTRAVDAAQRALALAQNRHEDGITTYLEVVTAQAIALGDARVAVDLQTRRMTSSVDLIKALGGGWSASELPSTRQILWGPAPEPTSHLPTFDPLREEPRWRALAEKLARTAPILPVPKP